MEVPHPTAFWGIFGRVKSIRKLTSSLLLTVGLAGCSHRGVVDGFTVNLNNWEKCKAAVGSRATFEFGCPVEELEMHVLGASADWPNTIGVSGCGYRAVFVPGDGTGHG